MQPIDLRSDTVTLPPPAMRQAIATAEVGDDVMGEDPTVNRLEAMAAERLGKEAAVFVASGTMGNLVALLAHCGRGEEMIVGDNAHIFMYEAGGSSALGGIHSRQVPNQTEGTMDLTDIEAAIRSDNPHFPRSRLICLENTHNRCGGACLTPDYMGRVRALADKHDLKIHLDGARVFNASIALGVGLFFGLAWQVFAPLLWGSPPAGPGPLFWWAFSLATFFLTLGLAARQQLAKAFRRLFHGMH